MSSTQEHLERWLTAGLLDTAAADRIRAFEEAPAARQEARGARPGIMEVLVYLGLAVVFAGAAILVGTSYGDYETWAKIAVFLVPGALALAAGWALKTQDDPPLQRGGQLAWFVAVAFLTAAAAVSADAADASERQVALSAAVTALVLGGALWSLWPTHPQVLAVGGASLLFSMAIGSWAEDNDIPVVLGLVLSAFGLGYLVLAELGYFRPRTTARLVAAGALAFGTFMAGVEEGPAEVLIFIAGAALIAAGVSRGAFVYVGFGVGAVFVGLIRTITMHVDSATQAAVSLMGVGVLLIATVILLALSRPWQRMRRHAA